MISIKRLLERYDRLGAATLQDRPEQLFDAAPTPAIGLWRLWAHAESFLLLKDWSRALGWLNACEALIKSRQLKVGQVWLADFLTSKGRILQKLGESGQALPYLDKALSTWLALFERLYIPPSQQERPMADEIAELFEAITHSDELVDVRDQSQSQVINWMQERLVMRRLEVANDLISALSAAGAYERGRQVAEDTFIWLPTSLEPQSQPWFKFSLRMALGNLELAAGDIAASVREFDRAARLFEHDNRYEAFDRRCSARFNKANSLLRQKKYAEARKLYRELKGDFAQRGNDEGVRRIRYALLQADYDENPHAPIEADLRVLARDYEQFVSEQRDPQNFHIHKLNLEQVYRLLLTVLASSATPDLSLAIDCLSIVRGLRETNELANLDRPRSLPAADWLAPMVQNVMPVLAEHLTSLPSTGLVVIESGVNCLIVIAVHPVTLGEQEVAVAVVDEDHIAPFTELIEQTRRISDSLSARTMTAKSAPSEELVATARSVWNALALDTRRVLDACSTLLYSPSAWGAIDELPLELVHTGDTWLGLTKNIARVPSLSALAELLAPNQIPRQLKDRAYVLRAEDPPDLDQLESADRVAKSIHRAAGILGLESTLGDKPTPDSTLQALNNGNRLFHYEGHGMADDLGEWLYVNRDQVVSIEDFKTFRDYTTPFSYLNCCEVGRGRHLQGGKQEGIAIGLLAHGAPALIAANYAVPDHVLGDVALSFYSASARERVGAALREAHVALEKRNYHPVCWASFGLQGDPFFAVSPEVDKEVQGSRRFTLHWPAHLMRYLASKSEEDLNACIADLRNITQTVGADLATTYHAVEAWIATDSDEEPDVDAVERLAQEIATTSLTGAVALRQWLAVRRIEHLTSPRKIESLKEKRSVEEQQELLVKEIGLGLSLSIRLRDVFAFCAFAALHAKHLTGVVQLTETMKVLRAARQYITGLTSYSERFSDLAKEINKDFEVLDNKVLFDLANVMKVGH